MSDLPEEIGIAIAEFFIADMADKRPMVKAKAALLLRADAVAYLNLLADNTAEGIERQLYRFHARILDACRVDGVDAVFDQLEQAITVEPREPLPWDDLSGDVHALLMQLLGLPMADKAGFVARHADALVDDKVVAFLRAYAAQSADQGQQIQADVALLERCIEVGVEAAASEFEAINARLERLGLVYALLEAEPRDHAALAQACSEALEGAVDGDEIDQLTTLRAMELRAAAMREDRPDAIRDAATAFAELVELKRARGEAEQMEAALVAQLELLASLSNVTRDLDHLRQALDAMDAHLARLDHHPVEIRCLHNRLRCSLAKETLDVAQLKAIVASCAALDEQIDRVRQNPYWLDNLECLGLALIPLAGLTADPRLHLRAADAFGRVIDAIGASDDVEAVAASVLNQSIALEGHSVATGDSGALDRAIVALGGALDRAGDRLPPFLRAALTGRLAATLSILSTQRDDRAVMQRAIETYDLVVELHRESPDYWRGQALTNRAAALGNFGEARNEADLLERSIGDCEEALALLPGDDFAARATLHQNWGNNLKNLGEMKKDRGLLSEALAQLEKAQGLRAGNHLLADLAITDLTMGASRFALALLDRDAATMRAAMEDYDRAAPVLSAEASPALAAMLARNRALAFRFLADWQPAQALDHLRAADAAFAVAVGLSGEANEWHVASHSGINHGLVKLRLGDWEDAATILGAALHLGIAAASLAPTSGEQERIAATLSGIGDAIAYAEIRAGRPDRAIATLYRGRGIQLSLSFALRTAGGPRLRAVRADWYAASARMRLIEQALAGGGQDRTMAAAMAAERDTIGRTIAGFMAELATLVDKAGGPGTAPPALSELSRGISVGGALVVPVVSEIGAAILIIPHGARRLDASNILLLDQLTTSTVEQLLFGSGDGRAGWFSRYEAFRGALAGNAGVTDTLTRWNRAIEDGLDTLDRLLMGPVSDRLDRLGFPRGAEIVVAPPGRLGVLPLAAAGRRDPDGEWHCFVDRWATRCVPGLSALDPPTRFPAAAPTLLAVTDPLGDLGRSDNPAASAFPPDRRHELQGGDATPGAVVRAAADRDYLSFYCHGGFDPSDPRGSGLILTDGQGGESFWTTEAIRRLDLSRGRLAILGACETALIDVGTLPDEFVGLPAAFLEAGVGGVIASNWIVGRDHAHWLVRRVVDLHLAGRPSADALREAMIAMRDRGPSGATSPSRSAPCDASDDALDINAEVAATSLPADAAFFWAAFTAWGQ